MSYPMTNNGLVNAVANLPLLEVLELSETWENLDLKTIGHSCPKLTTLKLNCSGTRMIGCYMRTESKTVWLKWKTETKQRLT